MNNLYQRFNDIINPGFKYFSAESEEFRKGKQEFEDAIEQGDASMFVDVLEEEYAHIRTTGSSDYKHQIHCLITAINTAAWKHKRKTVELTNEEIQYIKLLLGTQKDTIVDTLKEKFN